MTCECLSLQGAIHDGGASRGARVLEHVVQHPGDPAAAGGGRAGALHPQRPSPGTEFPAPDPAQVIHTRDAVGYRDLHQ